MSIDTPSQTTAEIDDGSSEDAAPETGSEAVAPREPAASALAFVPSRRTAVRLMVGVLALTTLATVVNLAETSTPAAAASCTGWTSKIVPPRTIRVLRTSSGRIQTVAFRRYVAEVMASGEWPSRLHDTTLETGAVATKQYAWYYALKGHHRSSYRRGGRCYDVRDDTQDQLFRPERARPTKRQLRAIAATWDLTLRKNGRFFLTGYRAGSSSRCAADANGWKLYAKSVQACAKKGWSRQRVQRAYLSPNLTFVWGSRIGPAMRKPNVKLRAGNVVPKGTATLSWRTRSRSAKVRRVEVQRRVAQRPWRRVKVGASARRTDVAVRRGHPVRFRVRAVDRKGHRGPWAYSEKRKSVLRGDRRVLVSSVRASGAHRASRARPRAGLRFRGHAVAVVARTGPGMGRARITLNGKRVASIDLSASKASRRTIVWARNFDARRKGRIRVSSVDGKVILRGFVVLR